MLCDGKKFGKIATGENLKERKVPIDLLSIGGEPEIANVLIVTSCIW